jgi:excisionase family DNA binding protein
MSTVEHGRMLTVEEAAARLGISRATAWRRIRSGELPAVQLGGPRSAVRIDPRELERFVYGEPPEAA